MSRKAVAIALASAGSAAVLAATLPSGGPLAIAEDVLVWTLTVRLDGLLIAAAAFLSLLGCLAVCGGFFTPDENGEGDGIGIDLRAVGYVLAGIIGIVTVSALASGEITKITASWGLGLAVAPVLLSLALPVAWALAGIPGWLTRNLLERDVPR